MHIHFHQIKGASHSLRKIRLHLGAGLCIKPRRTHLEDQLAGVLAACCSREFGGAGLAGQFAKGGSLPKPSPWNFSTAPTAQTAHDDERLVRSCCLL